MKSPSRVVAGAASLAEEIAELRAYADPLRLPFAFAGPTGYAELRHCADDFRVTESTGLVPVGHGEHLWLRVRKVGQNTRWVAKRLAEFAGIPYADASFAGLKDRHAVAEQWFSLRLAGQAGPDWGALNLAGVEVLESHWHERKLRPGQVSLNRFDIRLRACRDVDAAVVAVRAAQLSRSGMPNYFGSQRFGRGAGNLDIVLRQPELRQLGRETRGFALSALRGALFNGYLAQRVRAGTWHVALEGEIRVSDRPRGGAEGDHSVFRPERLPAGLLWGQGSEDRRSTVVPAEAAWYARFPAVTAALERAGSRCSQRVLQARIAGLECRPENDGYRVKLILGPGAFATMALREIFTCLDTAVPE